MIQKVIRGDDLKFMESFDDSETMEIINKYEELGYEDVAVDRNGDIIIFKKL
jgi:hypothetical protein